MLYHLLTFRFWIFDLCLIWTCIILWYVMMVIHLRFSSIWGILSTIIYAPSIISYVFSMIYFFFSKQSSDWIFFVSSRKVIILNILLSHNAYPYTSQIFQPFFLIMVILTSIWHCLLCSFTSWVALWKHAPWLNFLSWALYSQVARNNFNREPSLRSVLSDPLS